MGIITIILFAYLLGSIPTGYLFCKHNRGVDIRTVGDGNMGARNVYHLLGAKYGYSVALIDILKGMLPVLVAQWVGLTSVWQFVIAICTILGHDFSIFIGFRGGQGLAIATGTMLVLFPLPALAGMAVYALTYFLLKNSRVGAALAGGLIALILLVLRQWPELIYTVGVLLFIPFKLFLDTPRRKAIAAAKLHKEE